MRAGDTKAKEALRDSSGAPTEAATRGGKPAPRVHLHNFDGPLDLLLFLIRQQELDIYDIPIAEVTAQYLEYLADLESVNLDLASDFLVMAATLLEIKAKMLLPKPPKAAEPVVEEAGPDPRAELVERLLEYSRFKEAAGFLREMETEQGARYFRPLAEPGDRRDEAPLLEGVTLQDLTEALRELLQEAEENWREVPRQEIPLREKIREISWRLTRARDGITFRELVSRGLSRLEVVVTFLALLELIRTRRVLVSQDRVFGEILIRRVLKAVTGKDGGN
jgi:segregation and condensation protein A